MFKSSGPDLDKGEERSVQSARNVPGLARSSGLEVERSRGVQMKTGTPPVLARAARELPPCPCPVKVELAHDAQCLQ